MANEFNSAMLSSLEDESTAGMPEQAPQVQAPEPIATPIQEEKAEPTYADALLQMRDEDKNRLKQTLYTAKDADPDRAAKIVRLADEMKLPKGFVERNYDDISKKSELGKINLDQLVDQNPALTEFLSDPTNAELAKDDIDNLRALEDTVKDRGFWHDFKNSMGMGFAQFNQGLANTPGFLYDAAAMPQNAYYYATNQPEKMLSSNDIAALEPARYASQQYQKKAQDYREDSPILGTEITKEIASGNYAKAGKALAFQIAAQSPNTIAMLAMGEVGGLSMAGVTTAANKNQELQDQGVSPLKAPLVGVVHGAAEVVGEKIGTFGVAARVGKLMAPIEKQYGKEVAKQVTKEFLITVAKGMGEEGMEEAVTTLAQSGTDKLTGVNDQAMDGIGYQMIDSFLIGAGSSATTTVPVATVQARYAKQLHNQAVSDRNFYLAMGETLQASKLRERLPEAQAKYIEKLTKDSPIENIHIPIEAVDEYFQDNTAKVMQDLGVLKEYNEAKETGSTVKIPLSIWASKVVGTEHYTKLQNDVKFSENELTYNEAQKLREETEAQLKALNEEANEPEVETDPFDQVFDQINSRLKEIGYTDEQSGAYANVEAARAIVRAQRNGLNEDPFKLWSSKELQINQMDAPENSRQLEAPESAEVIPFPEIKRDEAGKIVYEPQHLEALAQMVGDSELIQSGAKLDQDGYAVGSYGGASTFPSFFKDKGYTKKEALNIIGKQLAGRPLTEKQTAILDDLYEGYVDSAKRGEMYQGGVIDKVKGIAEKVMSSLGLGETQEQKDEVAFKRFHEEEKARIAEFFEDPKRIDEYLALEKNSHGIIHLDTDMARELLPEYGVSRQSRMVYSDLTDDAAGKFIAKLYAQLLKEEPSGMVSVFGGGPGSGKSETLEKLDNSEVEIIYDSVSANPKYAIQRVEDAANSGRAVEIRFVYTPLEFATKWIKKRYENKERGGRPVDADYAVKAHINAVETMIELGKKYQDDPMVTMQIIDNTDPSSPKSIGVEDLIKKSYIKNNETTDEAVARLLPEVERQLGHVTEEVRAAKQRAANSKRDQARASQSVQRKQREESARLPRGSEESQQRDGQNLSSDDDTELFQSAPLAPPFYSKLTKTIEDKMANAASPKDVLGLIKEIKEDERKWSGIDDFLKGKEKVTKTELLDFLRANQLEIKEVKLGGDQAMQIGAPVWGFFSQDGEWLGTIANESQIESKRKELAAELEIDESEIDVQESEYDGEMTLEDIEHVPDELRPTKYHSYTLPGGENYREILFTLPQLAKLPPGYTLKKDGEFYTVSDDKGMPLGSWRTEAAAIKAMRRMEGTGFYQSSHWDEANVLAHTRLKDYTDADGKKVLLVEEIQSDWHQAGRKKGYKQAGVDEALIKEHKEAFDQFGQQNLELRTLLGTVDNLGFSNYPQAVAAIRGDKNILASETDEVKASILESFNKLEVVRNRVNDLEVALGKKDGAVPDAPFKKNWHEFVLKRLIRMAAEQGYDRIAWTPGEQQAERYDLSKSIDRIVYGPSKGKPGTYNVIAYAPNGRDALGGGMMYGKTESELEDIVGKEITKKIVSGEGAAYKAEGAPNEKVLAGLDLKVGGEGMKGFYDKILPEFANKFVKKYGAKVQKTSVDTSGGKPTSYNDFDDYLDARNNGRPQEVHSIDITPELRDAALNEGFSLFQGESVKRGRIRFGQDRKFAIDLFQDKDLSTFLHESGHMWLEELVMDAFEPGTPDQLRTDLDTVLEWMNLDVRSSDGLDAVRAAIKVDQHEQWARGVEAYFMSGKAPSESLREVFAKFKVWLTLIYKKIANLNVQITPEVQSVMDRMLATDEQISSAYQEPQYKPLITDPRNMGMNEEQAAKYTKAFLAAEEAAKDRVLARLMRDHEKQFNAEAKAARDVIKERVTNEVNQEKIYNVIAILQKNKHADGSDLPAGTEAMKIDRASLLAEFGPGIVESLPRGITSKDGMHVSLVADSLGFEGSQDLIEQLKSAQPKQERISQQVQVEFEATHPDLLKQPELKQEVIDSTHNESRAQILRMELEWLAANNMPLVKDAIRRVARRVPTEADVRKQATEIIAQRKVKDLKPHLFMRAEIKAANEAGKLLAAGDIAGAFEAKRKELLNHELYRTTLAAKERVEKAAELAKKFMKKDEKLAKTRDMDLINAGRAILALHGIGKRDQTPQSYLTKMQAYDPEAYAEMLSLVEAATVNSGPINEISFNDFVTLHDTLKAIWSLSKESQEMVIDGKKVALSQIKEELSLQLQELTKDTAKPGTNSAVTDKDKRIASFMSWRASLRRMEHWASALGRGSNKGAFTRFFINPVMEATTQYRIEKKARMQQFKNIIEPLKGELGKPQQIKAANLDYTFSSKAELLGAILHSGNESNLEKLLLGRNWGSKSEDGVLDRSRWDAFMNHVWNNGIISETDMKTVQAIWDFMDEMKPAAQKAHKKMFGYYFNEVTANEVVTPFGTFRGGYVPAMADTFIVEDADIRQDKELLEQGGNSFMFPTAGRGFTKSRVQNYNAPLVMDMRLVPMHIDKVLRFTQIEPVIKDLGRIMVDKTFRKTLGAYDSTVAGDLIMPWLQRTAQQRVMEPSQTKAGKAADAVLSKMKTSASLQMMALNLTNALQNFTSLFPAAVRIKPRRLLMGLMSVTRNPNRVAQEIAEKSKFMSTRLGEQATDVQNDIQKILVDPTKFELGREWLVHHSQIFQRVTQNLVELATWTAAYDQAVEKGAQENEAVRIADSSVREIQGSLNPEDISKFETGTALKRALTMFYSYFNNQANLLGSEFAIHQELGLSKRGAHAFHAFMLTVIAPAVVGSVIARAMGPGLDEDDDGEYAEDLLDVLVFSPLRYLAAMVPGGAIINSAINSFNDKAFDDRITVSPIVSVGERMLKAPFTVAKAVKDEKKAGAAARDVLSAIGFITATPGGAMARPIGYGLDVMTNKTKPTGAVDFSRGMLTGKSSDLHK